MTHPTPASERNEVSSNVCPSPLASWCAQWLHSRQPEELAVCWTVAPSDLSPGGPLAWVNTDVIGTVNSLVADMAAQGRLAPAHSLSWHVFLSEDAAAPKQNRPLAAADATGRVSSGPLVAAIAAAQPAGSFATPAGGRGSSSGSVRVTAWQGTPDWTTVISKVRTSCAERPQWGSQCIRTGLGWIDCSCACVYI